MLWNSAPVDGLTGAEFQSHNTQMAPYLFSDYRSMNFPALLDRQPFTCQQSGKTFDLENVFSVTIQ
jgi:hypothetical protein